MALRIFLLFLQAAHSIATTIPCASLSSEVAIWHLSDWFTDFSTPEMRSSGGAVIFRLVNLITGFDSLCFRRGLTVQGQCIWAAGGESVDDETETWFSFSDRDGELHIFQKWTCLDSGIKTKFEGQGRATIEDKCELGDTMPKGKICGKQGAEGDVYPDTLVKAE